MQPFRPRVPYIAQMDIADCGAACLAMILAALGHHAPLATVRESCGVSRDGTSAYAIARAAQLFGLAPKALRVDASALEALPIPAVLHWQFRHFVVLESITRKGATIVDPARGRVHLGLDELRASFTGIALSFEPGPAFRRRGRSRPSFARFRAAVRSSGESLGLLIGTAFLVEIVTITYPASSQILIDYVIQPRQDRLAVAIFAVVGATVIVKLLLSYLKQAVHDAFFFALDVGLKSGFVDHLVGLPIAFLKQRRVGDLMDRVRGSAALRDVSTLIVTALLDGLLVFGYSSLMLAYDLWLGAAVIGMSVARAALVASLGNATRETSARQLERFAQESTVAVEAFAIPEMTKAFRAEGIFEKRFLDRLTERLNASGHSAAITDGTAQVTLIIDGLCRALILWIGGCAVLENRMTIGIFSAFVMMQSLLSRPLAALVNAAGRFFALTQQIARLDDIEETPREHSGGKAAEIPRGDIELDGVAYRYPHANASVLEDISLRVPAGQTLAIVGASGAGKSTLGRLILGLIPPTCGRVLIDGDDIAELDSISLRQHVGVVLQDTFLYDGSVRENLDVLAREIPWAELEEACRVACIDDVVAALPQGYNTLIGENGSRLSGGQRQRLALARAIAHKPRILLLDEATSALDLPTERRVFRNLKELECTTVVIAHRLATIRQADEIIVLRDGRVAQRGDFDELRAREGEFRELLTADARLTAPMSQYEATS